MHTDGLSVGFVVDVVTFAEISSDLSIGTALFEDPRMERNGAKDDSSVPPQSTRSKGYNLPSSVLFRLQLAVVHICHWSV